MVIDSFAKIRGLFKDENNHKSKPWSKNGLKTS